MGIDSLKLTEHEIRTERLLKLIRRHQAILKILSMDTEQKNLEALEQSLLSDGFKILVMGEFKRGKSTLINSMLGRKILPSYPWEATAIINEIKWGDAERAVLYSTEGGKERHIEIPVTELEKYVLVQKKEQDSPYDRVEISWPLTLLKNGVLIVDSPGLNVSNTARKARTMNYIPQADAAVLVFFCQAVGSASELQIIDILQDAGHTSLFMVCNRINEISPALREETKRRYRAELAPHTKPREKFVFFVDARGALEARIILRALKALEALETSLAQRMLHKQLLVDVYQVLQEATTLDMLREPAVNKAWDVLESSRAHGPLDERAVRAVISAAKTYGEFAERIQDYEQVIEESGVPDFEKALQDFLVREKGRVKLLRPATALQVSVHDVQAALDERKKLLHTAHGELKERYQQAEKRLAGLERERAGVVGEVRNFRLSISRPIKQAAREFYNSLVGRVDEWVSNYEIQQPIRATELLTKGAREEAVARVASELDGMIAEHIRVEFKTWRDTTLKPLLDSKSESLMQSLIRSLREFLQDFRQMRLELLADSSDESLDSNENIEVLVNEVLAKAGGYNAGPVDIGGGYGAGAMLRNLILPGGALAALTLLFSWHPILFLGAAILAVVVTAVFQRDKASDKVKETFTQEYKKQMLASLGEIASQLADKIDEELETYENNLDQVLGDELQKFREQVKAVLDDIEKDQVEQKLTEIEECGRDLAGINGELAAMIAEFQL
jgi:GTPase SAR1 family protein